MTRLTKAEAIQRLSQYSLNHPEDGFLSYVVSMSRGSSASKLLGILALYETGHALALLRLDIESVNVDGHSVRWQDVIDCGKRGADIDSILNASK